MKSACWIGLWVVTAMGCGVTGENIGQVNGRAVPKAQFDAYLKYKRLDKSDPKRLASLQQQYLEQEALADAISKQGKLDKALIDAEVNEYRKEIMINRYFDQYLRDSVTDEAVQNFYASHAKDYEERKVHVAHVLVRAERSMAETERKAKLSKAQDAYAQLRSGKEFDKVAEAVSEDVVSAKKGGDLGWMKEGSIDAVFSQKMFALAPGQYSEPFETPFGFHVIKVIEGPAIIKRPFETVQGDIRYQLRNQTKDAEMKRLTGLISIDVKTPKAETSSAAAATVEKSSEKKP